MIRAALFRSLIVFSLLGGHTAMGASAPPRLLLVVAHPDDELIAAAAIYRLTKELGGTVDQLVITNGEGGYRYSTPAEKIYGLKLTDETVARRELPEIRKREALAAGRILGIRNHYFLDEPDVDNTDDPNAVLQGSWNVEGILNRLGLLLARGNYDFVLVPLPWSDAGGHHRAAALLTIRALARFEGRPQPVLLGAFIKGGEFTAVTAEAAGFSGEPDFNFDRARKFGFNDALDYHIIANWVIAEHKSQGLYQTNVGRFTHEYFWVHHRADPEIAARAQAFFALLAGPDA